MKILRNKYFIFFLGFVFIIAFWALISFLVDVNSMVFPSPLKTFKLMFHLLGERQTYVYLWYSLKRLIIGFVLSFVLAFLLGIIVNNNETLYNFFSPIITFFKAAPTATFVFLFVVLFTGNKAPAYVVVTMTFPILYESIVSALKSTEKTILEASKIDGASKFSTLFKVQIPLGMPFITLGIISTFGMAFKVEIMAEIITRITSGGLGTMIMISQLLDATDLTPMFAYSLIAIILVLLVSIAASVFKSKIIKPKAKI